VQLTNDDEVLGTPGVSKQLNARDDPNGLYICADPNSMTAFWGVRE
jgi:hypothetical protein